MAWLYLLVVAPVYGVVAAQCLVQGFTYLALVLISLMGFSKGSAPRDELLAALGASLLGVLIFAALLAGGVYLMHSYTAFGQKTWETIVFWVFAIGTVCLMAKEVTAKLKQSWADLAE